MEINSNLITIIDLRASWKEIKKLSTLTASSDMSFNLNLKTITDLLILTLQWFNGLTFVDLDPSAPQRPYKEDNGRFSGPCENI